VPGSAAMFSNPSPKYTPQSGGFCLACDIDCPEFFEFLFSLFCHSTLTLRGKMTTLSRTICLSDQYSLTLL
jgi:hypothetical protein